MTQAQTITKLFNGNPVEVLAVAGGWSTINVDGEQRKVRNSTLFDLPANAVVSKPRTRAEAIAMGKADAAEIKGRRAEAPATPHNRFAEKQAAEAKRRDEQAAAAAVADGEAAVEVKATKSIVKSDYKAGYERTDIKTASGSKVIDCGDKVAQMFRGKSLDECYVVVAEDMTGWVHPKVYHSGVNGGAESIEKDLRALYGHLNPGQQRMNLGNLIRPWHKLDDAAKKQLLDERVAKRQRAADRAAAKAAVNPDDVQAAGDAHADAEAKKAHAKSKRAAAKAKA